MLFNSLHFLIFFPIVVVLFFALKQKNRSLLLLAASYYFYMCWKVEYLGLIVLSTVVDYFAAIQIARLKTTPQKRLLLLVSLAVNLGILFFFKYFNFFNENLDLLFSRFNIFYNAPEFDLLLPVGISFYTFQTLSYTIDVYQGKLSPEKNFTKFAVFVSFFPQLVAGPIERATHLLPQFSRKINFDYARVASGLRLMLWGLFKKIVVADRLAMFVDSVYGNVDTYTGLPLLWATYFFAIQIYCDFSGYTDIAIGAARVMGFDLMQNFNFPYFAKNIREFWARWHISLTTWFRDYLYIPLGGNRKSQLNWAKNVLIVFLVSGFWHGANWTFIIWGGLHGLYFLLSRLVGKLNITLQKGRISGLINMLITFHAVLLAWVFFRAENVADAHYVITHLFKIDIGYLVGVPSITKGQFLLTLVALGLFGVSEILIFLNFHRKILKYRYMNYAVVFVFVLVIYLIGVFEDQQFIYFQF